MISSRKTLNFLLGLLLLAVYWNSVLTVLNTELTGDETLYLYFAKYWVDGGKFFDQRWFDDKPGGAQILYLLANILDLSRINIINVRIFTCLYNAITYILFYVLCKRIANNIQVSLLATVIYIIVSTSSIVEGSYSNADNFVSMGIIAAAILTLSEKYYSAAFVVGLFFCIKQNIALEILPSTILLYLDRLRKNPSFIDYIFALRFNLIQFVVFITPMTALALYAYAYGDFNHFLRATFLDRIYSHLTYKNYDFALRYGLPILRSLYVYWLAMIILLLYLPFAIVRHVPNASFVDIKLKVYLFFWIIASAIGVWVGGYFFPHYFLEIIPVLVVSTVYVALKSNLSLYTAFVAFFSLISWVLKGSSFFWIQAVIAILYVSTLLFVAHRDTMKLFLLAAVVFPTLSYSDLNRWQRSRITTDNNVSNLYKASKYIADTRPNSLFVYDYVMEIYTLSGIHPKDTYPAKFQYINHNKLIADNRNYPDNDATISARWTAILRQVLGGSYDLIAINYGNLKVGEFPYLSRLLNIMCEHYAVDKIFGDVWIYKAGGDKSCKADNFDIKIGVSKDLSGASYISLPLSIAPYPSFQLRCDNVIWSFPENGIDRPLRADYNYGKVVYSVGSNTTNLKGCEYHLYDILSGRNISGFTN